MTRIRRRKALLWFAERRRRRSGTSHLVPRQKRGTKHIRITAVAVGAQLFRFFPHALLAFLFYSCHSCDSWFLLLLFRSGFMAASKKVRVAIVGLGFGAEFIPIYQAHPDAEMYAICRRNRQELDACGDKFGVKARYTDYNQLLKDPNIDAVHINSHIPYHAALTLAALHV